MRSKESLRSLRRAIVLVVAGASVASLVSACDFQTDRGIYHSGYGPGSAQVDCRQMTTCGTCTPQSGCGWCTSGAAGLCVTDPNECPGTSFDFTWEPSGCPGFVADAGVTPVDASVPEDALPEGSPVDTGADASDAATE